ncbi:MAG: Cof-type HAD-IIB family hydrolase [Streptococcaceae bacterium]|jgi:Cof subfamily protein (haloacid dehalogenase superfamily)|nr:Cof-type HAD-IIB family hydrolase [Streptococcaceae bacterium]
MAEVKAVFFDLDGTLLTPTRGIAPSTRQAISDLRRNGILVGIATGRGPAFALPLLEELGLNFAVTYNGQYIIDAKNVLYANPLDKRLVHRIVRYAADNHRDLSFGLADGVSGSGLLKFGETRTGGFIAGLLPSGVANIARTSFKTVVRKFRPVVYDLRKLLKEPIYQIMMVATANETTQLESRFSDLFVTRSSPYTADLISKGTSKLRGIKRLGDIFDFSLSEVMTFGDSENDVNMLEGSGIGIAMGNARPEAKEVANYITTSNSQDGIARALAYYGLVKFDEAAAFLSKDIAFNKVKEFHRLMDGTTQEVPKAFTAIEAGHRADFEVEEIVEFLYAASLGDPVRFDTLVGQLHGAVERAAEKVAAKAPKGDALTAQTDSLIDLLYLTYGSLVLSGVDPYEIFEVVHRANMAKIFPDGQPHFDAQTHKVLKPEDWEEKHAPEPLIKRELDRQTRVALKKAEESHRNEKK